MYINNDREREKKFQKIVQRLQRDENRTYALSVKLEKVYFSILKKYRE